MNSKNRSLVLIIMSISLIAILAFVFVPKFLVEFLLENRYLALGICFVAFVSIAGAIVVAANKTYDEELSLDTEVPVVEPVAEPVEEVVEEVVEEIAPAEEDADDEEESPSIIRLDYSFKSKLILSVDEIKNYYNEIVNYVLSYGVKIRKSWKKETIYLGRNVYAILTFKGKKLCVSFALDPKDYENSKYYFKDVSEIKKFEKTPLLMKITSLRKVKYTKELLEKIFTDNNLVDKKATATLEEIPVATKEELIEQGLIKDPSKVNA